MLKSENIQKSDKAPKVIRKDTFFRPYGLPSYSIYYMDDGTQLYIVNLNHLIIMIKLK